MKIQAIKVFTALNQAERTLLENLRPWNKSQWDKKVFLAGIDVKPQITAIKRKISASQLIYLNNCCTYCGSKLGITSDDELDHFINKARIQVFTFELQNLAIACHKCNFPTRKGQRKTYRRNKSEYAKCRFKIFHPFFDDPDKHFEYRMMNDRTVFIFSLTRKGRKTVSFFGLNEPVMAENRAKDYMYANITTPQAYQAHYDQILQNEYYSI